MKMTEVVNGTIMNEITLILTERDGLTPQEASELYKEAIEAARHAVKNGETPYNICQEWFELEHDYDDIILRDLESMPDKTK